MQKGGSNHTDVVIELVEDAIDVAGFDAFLRASEGGGICLFIGATRRVTRGRVTIHLEYEAAPALAHAEMARLLERARDNWPILRAVVVHRMGVVPVAEASVLIGVATAHRRAAFEACRFLIDELKRRVPIWKRETYDDGTSEWVGGTTPA